MRRKEWKWDLKKDEEGKSEDMAEADVWIYEDGFTG